MEETRRHAWLEWKLAGKCNFRCVYCGLSEPVRKPGLRSEIKKCAGIFFEAIAGRPEKEKATFTDVRGLRDFLARTDRRWTVSLTGGEPFLSENIVEICEAITERHSLALSTNLIPVKIRAFAEKIDPKKVERINASCHLKELERTRATGRYIDHYLLCQRKGFRIVAAVVAYPPLRPEVPKYREYFKTRGVDLCFVPFCGTFRGKNYPESYTPEEESAFGLDRTKAKNRCECFERVCNAGYNAFFADESGDVRPCYHLEERMGNVASGIRSFPELMRCRRERCNCPYYDYLEGLFIEAAREINGVPHAGGTVHAQTA
jgi:MoaA/NifB/PqqE/SkfB family radical SAM enzyme